MGNHGIFLTILWVMQDLDHQPYESYVRAFGYSLSPLIQP